MLKVARPVMRPYLLHMPSENNFNLGGAPADHQSATATVSARPATTAAIFSSVHSRYATPEAQSDCGSCSQDTGATSQKKARRSPKATAKTIRANTNTYDDIVSHPIFCSIVPPHLLAARPQLQQPRAGLVIVVNRY